LIVTLLCYTASFFKKDQDGSSLRAALLSGSPGVGKTTTATLVCEELGFSYIEMNASDTRNKKTLEEHISQSLSNKTMDGFLPGNICCSGLFLINFFLIKTITKFLNVIGYHQPDLITNRTVYVSCL